MKKESMSTLDKIKDLLTLSKSSKTHKVVFYKEAILEDGRTIVTESEEWTEGVEVRVLAEDGTAVVIEAGSYALEDGTPLVIDEGSALVSIGMEEEVEEVEEVEAQEEVTEGEEKEIKDAVADETAEAIEEAVMSPEVVEKVAQAINDATGDEVTPEIAKESAIAAISSIEAEIPAVTEEVKEELSQESELNDEVETFSAVANFIEEKFASLEKRIKELEDSPASTGLTHNPENSYNKGESINKVGFSANDRVRSIINKFN